jgi:hypothetical protein
MFRQSLQLAARQLSRRTATTCDNPWFRLAIVAVLTCLALPTPRAEAINITYTYDERSRPAFDPDGVELRRITDAAIGIWEGYILDDVDYHFDLSWENLGGGTFGQHEDFLGWATNNILIDTHAPDGSLRNWFFDPTPFSNNEFSMNQTLVRDVSATDIDAGFSGNPHQNFEVGFNGFANFGTPAVGKLDLLSIVTHELGHHLGFSYNGLFEDYYDMNPATTGGRSLGVLQVGDYEFNLDTVLMTDWPSTSGGERRLPSATDILATWDESVYLTYENGFNNPTYRRFSQYNLPRVDFLEGHTNSWHDTINWLGGKVPGTSNEVFIRHGGTVVQSEGTSAAKSLQITDNSNLYVKGFKLYVEGDTTVGKNGTRGDLHVGTLADSFATLETNNLFINNGIVNTYDPKGSVNVMRDLTIASNGTLMGAGVTRVGSKLVNNGKIEGGTFLLFGFGGTHILMTSGAGATLDLDGNGSEQGEISAVIGDLKIYGPLSDPFNGRAGIGETRTMHFSRPWDMKGSLNFNGGADVSKYATLSGAQVTISNIVNVKGHSMISAPVVLNDPAVVSLPAVQDTLVLGGTSTLRGGSFTGLGTLAIQGNTSVAMPNQLVPEDFPDEIAMFRTVDTGALDNDLVFEMNPDTKTSPDTVVVGNFTTFALNVPLQVRTGGVMTASVSSLYLPKQTTMSGGQITGTATVNQVGDLVADGNSTINPNTFLWGIDAASHRTTIRSGKRLDITPNRIVRSGEQVYKGNIVLETGATLNVNTATSDTWKIAGDLQMGVVSSVTGDNIINTGRVHGQGTINVAQFENSGTVKPGTVFGGISMPGTNYIQTPVGVLDMTLGSSLIGNGASKLAVGSANLAGTLSLSLMSGFNPAPGSLFDLITASSIIGQFSEIDLNIPFGTILNGDVLYSPNKVQFRVNEVSTNAAGEADFNRDGKVDGLDLAAWREAYGTVATKRSAAMGDADGDGDVDGRDMLIWQRQYNGGSKGSETLPTRRLATAVPEPGTMLLGAMALVIGCWKRSR